MTPEHPTQPEDEPYIAVPTYFTDQDVLEFVERDVTVIAREMSADWTLLLDMTTREPIGFRLNAPKRAFSTQPEDVRKLVKEARDREQMRERFVMMGPRYLMQLCDHLAAALEHQATPSDVQPLLDKAKAAQSWDDLNSLRGLVRDMAAVIEGRAPSVGGGVG